MGTGPSVYHALQLDTALSSYVLLSLLARLYFSCLFTLHPQLINRIHCVISDDEINANVKIIKSQGLLFRLFGGGK
jgi:hypothetical protein